VQLILPTIAVQIPAARPLVPVEAAMVILDRDEDEILHAIESGSLGWAWDIAAPSAERRELRIWRDSILTLAASQMEEANLDPERVIARVLPPNDLRSPQVQRLCSCSGTHIHALMEAGVFEVIQPPAAPSGPRSYSILSRDSVARFLRSRRVL
jgi:hypothetical protein